MKLVIVDRPRTCIENLAVNDACFEAVRGKEYEEIVRIYRFSRPGVILSRNQDVWDVREDAIRSIDITRRPSGGAAVYVDKNTIGYSIFGSFIETGAIQIHVPYKRMTTKIVDVLRSFGLEVGTEKHWGISVNGSIIAGHAQRDDKNTFEVHGLMRLKQWDMASLEKTLRLRKLGRHMENFYIIIDNKVYDTNGIPQDILPAHLTIVRDEYGELQNTPGLDTLGVNQPVLVERLSFTFSESHEKNPLPEYLLERAKKYEQEYEKIPSGSKKCLGHCFVDFNTTLHP